MIAERLYEFIISKKKILLSTLSLSVLLPSLLSLTNTKLAVSKPTKMPLPKLVAFDLDGTIWTPDMYQLWGGGAPFSMAKNGRDLLDRSGRTVRLLGISDKILHELRTNPEMTHIKVAWVSCTDEPDWADECLRKFYTDPSKIPLIDCADSSQIFKANKQTHFNRLKALYPDIDYSEMLFFDNENGNIRSVSQLGVKCVYCPNGMTEGIWQNGLDMFK